MAKKKPTPPSSEEPPRGRSRKVSRSDADSTAGENLTPPTGPPRSSKRRKAQLDLDSTAKGDPLDLARELATLAVNASNPADMTEMAKRALKISPDCAEAYLLLAEIASSRKQALAHYKQAVEASARVLGPEIFRQGEGMFWGLLETRFYMRAKLGLAEALWASGRRDEAVEHLFEMLRLNPNDNQGLRYILVGWLLNLDQLDRLDSLLASYDEDSTTWAYTRALAAFRHGGDSPRSRKLLTAAKKANKHVPDFLLGNDQLPPTQPPYYSPGDQSDAVIYVSGNLSAWRSSHGALTWVRTQVKPRRRRSKVSKATGPSPGSQIELLRLPAEPELWQADCRQFPRRVEIGGERIRPWMVLVADRTHELILAHALTEAFPTAEELWDAVAEAIERPATGQPHRPSQIQLRPGEHLDALGTHFEAIGIDVSGSEKLDQIDSLFEDLARHMAGSEPPGMLDMPGVKPEQVGRFFEAAAEFYRRAPWKSLGFEAVIRVECDRFQSGPWFAVIMGQSGLTLGLALYEDLTLLRKMWAGKLSDEQGARKTVALTITYDDDLSIPETDLEAIERYGWPVAAPEAYPSLFRKERGLSMRPPLTWEIDLMDACLRVLPDFVARRPADDTTRELVPVPGAVLATELGLCWIEESY